MNEGNIRYPLDARVRNLGLRLGLTPCDAVRIDINATRQR